MFNLKSILPFVFAILSIVIIVLFSNSKNKVHAKMQDDILWTVNHQLTWNDFQGIPDYNNDFVKALTASSIRYSYGCEEGVIVFHIEAIFKKDQSWVKEEAHTAYHLSHEQLHFDITELYARKLRNALKEAQFPCHRMYAFEQTIKEYLRKWRNEQQQYDRETFFSVKKEEQAEWFYQVNLQLEEDEINESILEY